MTSGQCNAQSLQRDCGNSTGRARLPVSSWAELLGPNSNAEIKCAYIAANQTMIPHGLRSRMPRLPDARHKQTAGQPCNIIQEVGG